MTGTTLCKDALELSEAINEAIDTGERANGELTHAAKLAVEAALRHIIRRGGVQWLALAAVCAVVSMILFRAGG